MDNHNVRNVVEAAKALNLKVGIIAVSCPHSKKPCPTEVGGVKVDSGGLCIVEGHVQNWWKRLTKTHGLNL